MAKNQTALLLGATLASLCLTSCGSKGVDNSKLVIGLECAYQPFNWTEVSANEHTLPISNEAGKFADGYDIAIAKYLSQELNKEVQIVKTEWESLIPDLQLGSINCVIAGMTDNAERRASIDFTSEYYHSELVLITSATFAASHTATLTNSDLTSILNNQIIVSQVSTVTNDCIDVFATNYGAIHGTPLATFADCAHDVASGAAFAMTAELPVALSLTAADSRLGIVHIEQSILGESAADLGVSIGIKKGNTELKDAINGALAKLSQEARWTMMEAAIARSADIAE